MTQKHTPGPWVLKVRKHDDFTVAEIEIDASPYRGDVARLQSCEHIDGIATDELLANARLIASAPELLEALEMAVLWLKFDGKYDVLGFQAAIAKAKGEPQ